MTIDVPSDIRESRRQKHAKRIAGPKFYIQWKYLSEIKMNKDTLRGFPGGPVVKIPRFQNRRHGFDPWLGNQDSACCKAGVGGGGGDILRWRKTKRIYWKRFTLNEWLGKKPLLSDRTWYQRKTWNFRNKENKNGKYNRLFFS